MTVSDQFNDYASWCKQKDDPPRHTDVGDMQNKHGLTGTLKWKVTSGPPQPGDTSAHVFFDTGQTFLIPFGNTVIEYVLSLKGGGYFQQGPMTPKKGIPLDFFELELLRPDTKDTAFKLKFLNLSKVDVFQFDDGDVVDGTLTMKPAVANKNSLRGSTKTKKGRQVSFTLNLTKGTEEQHV